VEIAAILIFGFGLYALFSAIGGSVSAPIIETTSGFSSATLFFAQAIAAAEGFGVAGSVPFRAHNPGDLSKGDLGDTGSYLLAGGTEHIIVFPSDSDGWVALYAKLQNIVDGKSKVYNLGMTIREMGLKYSGGDPNWAVNVSNYLGVSEDIILGEVLV
jgi:hypothetical protein